MYFSIIFSLLKLIVDILSLYLKVIYNNIYVIYGFVVFLRLGFQSSLPVLEHTLNFFKFIPE